MNNTDLDRVVPDCFNNVTRHSWTWQRLTEEEKDRFLSIDLGCIKGTANQRREIYFTIYSAFLHGIGYKPVGWREPATESPAPF